jgi:hypothetical protein
MAQILYAVVYTTSLYTRTWYRLLPRRAWGWIGWPYAFLFAVQGNYKHLLTEGDRIEMMAMAKQYTPGGMPTEGLAAGFLLRADSTAQNAALGPLISW